MTATLADLQLSGYNETEYGTGNTGDIQMAFDGITVANLQYELQQALEGGRISKIAQPEALYFCQCFPSLIIFDTDKQAQSAHRSGILHAVKKAYRRRTDHSHHPARPGKDLMFSHRASGRNG